VTVSYGSASRILDRNNARQNPKKAQA